MKRFAVCIAGLLLSAGVSLAADKGLVHCFMFTPVKEASQADWDAFYKATDELPGKVKGLKAAYAGKLARPFNAFGVADAEVRKKVVAEGKGTGDVTFSRRDYGVCMIFEDEAAFKAYGPDPAHKAWENVYGKVRVAGTTTFQLIDNQ